MGDGTGRARAVLVPRPRRRGHEHGSPGVKRVEGLALEVVEWETSGRFELDAQAHPGGVLEVVVEGPVVDVVTGVDGNTGDVSAGSSSSGASFATMRCAPGWTRQKSSQRMNGTSPSANGWFENAKHARSLHWRLRVRGSSMIDC